MKQHPFLLRLRSAQTVARTGQVRRILPTHVEADGPAVPLGALCAIETRGAGPGALAEVAAVNAESVVLVPFEDAPATFPGARVTACAAGGDVAVGDAFLGRAVDALGRPIDGRPAVRAEATAPLHAPLPSPLSRVSPAVPLETGIRAIDALLTLGKGQRIGLFAASGVGKTTLMAQLSRQVDAERSVICLVGERGREVGALWSGMSDEARSRTVLVAATSDESAAMRARACHYALTLADHWRRRGEHVIFFLDSVTRLAMALREIGLAAGEPPTVRAYTPSVFAALPKLVERCGALRSGGSITAIMTVLAETDEGDDPVCEAMKALLDGHILLSRSLAEQGHFPAIDVPRSISRLAGDLVSGDERAQAARALELVSTYEASKLMIEAGVYSAGARPEIDRAIAARPHLSDFLRQGADEHVASSAARGALAKLLDEGALR
jgi:flagellum-specific ATP synthase